MVRQRRFLYERYVCPKCRSTQPIPRRHGRRRAVGHKKWLWCWRCKKQTNHRHEGRW